MSTEDMVKRLRCEHFPNLEPYEKEHCAVPYQCNHCGYYRHREESRDGRLYYVGTCARAFLEEVADRLEELAAKAEQ